MREIKFRVWHKKYKEHFNIMELQFTNNGKISNIMLWNDEHTGANFRVKNIDDIIVEQYTGLKDIDGKEIYEGDIVKGYLIEDDKVETIIGTINRISGYIVDIKDTNMFMWVVDMEKLEIIGNIHENGDLLK